jgi:DNA (cytosine-5)-methyltransferase 1
MLDAGPSIGVELDHDACRTAVAAGHLRVRADVAASPLEHLAGRAEGLVMSPPCQAWSRAGKRGGIADQPRIFDHLAAVIAAGRWVDYSREGWADPRSPLVLEVARWVDALRPQWVACEQVPDVLPFWQAVARWLRSLGYQTATGLLSAERYGVPQTRLRAFLVAARDGRPVRLPAPTHARYVPARRWDEPAADGLFDEPARERVVLPADRGLLPWVSMADALGASADRPARTVCGDRSPRWAYGPGRSSYDTGWTLETEQRSDTAAGRAETARQHDQPATSLVANADRWELRTNQVPDGTSEYQRRPVDEPAPTVSGQGKSWGWELHPSARERANDRTQPRPLDTPAMTVMFGHSDMRWQLRNNVSWVPERPSTTVCGDPRLAGPGHRDREGGQRQYDDQAVRLTIEQAGVLQSFPADYPWRGTKTARFRQAGDAVPPLLAAAVLGELLGVDWRRRLWGVA